MSHTPDLLTSHALDLLHEQGYWMPYAWHLAKLVRRMAPADAPPPSLLLWAVAATAQATCSCQHVCLMPDALPSLAALFQDPPPQDAATAPILTARFPKEWADILASPACAFAVSRPVAGELPAPDKPIILENRRIYLHRFWTEENRLAGMLRRRAAAASPGQPPSPEALAALTDRRLDSLQLEAAGMILSSPFAVITGGPGTGKTTLVALALAALLSRHPEWRIALCAPSGKAQARLKDAISGELSHLHLEQDPALMARLAALEPSTIHRLLKYSPTRGFKHTPDNPLPVQLLIVDESSMVSLPLMTRLLASVPTACRVVLLGDHDQLAAVETGAVLADICHAWGGEPFVKRLTRSYRFDSTRGIGRLKDAVNCGSAKEAWRLLTESPDSTLARATPPSDDAACLARLETLVRDSGFSDYLHADAPADAFAAFNRFRILCAARQGFCGVDHMNRLMQRLLDIHADGPGYPVLITVNDYTRKLFNGDVGITRQERDGTVKVWFPDSDRPGEYRSFAPAELPPHEPVFAMTVHKAQGSGFDTVLLIFPPHDMPILSREWLYTGMTRARKKCVFWAPRDLFCRSVERAALRMSGLREKLSSEETVGKGGGPI